PSIPRSRPGRAGTRRRMYGYTLGNPPRARSLGVRSRPMQGPRQRGPADPIRPLRRTYARAPAPGRAMLRVLRHYLPIRKALLILSETALLTIVISLWMTAHLWDPPEHVRELLSAYDSMSPENAILRCIYSSFFLAFLSQIAIAFNELYDVRISGSRYDRAGRFVESAGSGLFLTLLAVVLVHVWSLKRVLDFPPLTLSQRVQGLVFALLSGFLVLYYWRALFHYLLRRSNFSERVLILGSGKAAHALA